ncbi:uncharacterized protein PAC_17423 [Phialocephala subalpina]|uniref:Clr5 domain-containing protein n=1 Tax=Phialocephala subalpina TaxID=576137 RepID=A0A1L7XR59_9HELO|nr:uncharacterized protein PAC_17423 [Phialocephala subalpina]
MNDPGEVSLKPAQTYTSQEWEQKRPLITRLYRDESRTLYQVRLALAQETFRPTEAMLKKRIKKWDLNRNFKEADMIYALNLALEREKSGKQTEFLIRERTVTFCDIQKYFRRKGIQDLQAFVDGKSSVQPTTTIRSYTPSAENAVEDDLDEVHTTAQSDLLSHSGPEIRPVSRTTLVQLEEILQFGRIFYDAVCRQGRAMDLCPEFRLPDLRIFHEHLRRAHLLLDQHRTAEAFQHFNDCFDLVPHLIRSECPILIPCLYQILIFDWHITSIDIIGRLVGFVADMMVTRNHPGASIARLLPQFVFIIMPLRRKQLHDRKVFEQSRDMARRARASTKAMLPREYPEYPLELSCDCELVGKIDWVPKKIGLPVARLDWTLSPALVSHVPTHNQKDDREYSDQEDAPMVMDKTTFQPSLDEQYSTDLFRSPAVLLGPTHLDGYQFVGFQQSTLVDMHTTPLSQSSTSDQLSYQFPTYEYHISFLEEGGSERSISCEFDWGLS